MGNLQEEQLAPQFSVSRNIFLQDSDGFGSFDHGIVFSLLRLVQENFYKWTACLPYSDCCCLVGYKEDWPCIYALPGIHVINLHVSGNYWCKWVYQFAHEYCHHMIGGKMNGERSGLFWFEETICELSSMHNLHGMVSFCEKSSLMSLRRFAPAVRDYLGDLLKYALPPKDVRGFVCQHTDALRQPLYHRDIYSTLAASIFPLFVRDPNLWKVILHFGDMSRWASLEVLFRHLHETSDDSYSSSLANLDRLLLG